MELILIRHGESEGNITGNVYGYVDYPLTPKGLIQAEAIRKHLKNKQVDQIYTSPLIRASIIGQGIATDHDLEVIYEKNAMEKYYGEYEDQPVKALQKQLGLESYYQVIDPFSSTFDIPNEPGLGFYDRVKTLLESIIETHDNSNDVVVLTTHQGVIRVISQILLNYRPEDMMHYKWEPGCIARFQIKNGFGKLVELIQTY